jgi:major membrane immunogen (membrane-anchored lipoprotein)
MKNLLIAIILILTTLITSCTSPDSTTRIVSDAGYTNVQTTGYRIFGCSDDDTFRTGFQAISANGKKVSGVVCGGILKGSTIRLD